MISIVIPAYKEATRIGKTLEGIAHYFENNSMPYEVIVVDDGSPDSTGEVARRYASKIENFTVLVNEKNSGKGFSVKRGMEAARGEYRLFMDADSSVDISHLDEFMRTAKSGFDVVIGSIHANNTTKVAEHNGFHRRFLGAAANVLIQLLATPGIEDTQRGFKLFSARAAEAIFPRQTIKRFGFDIEVLVIARKNGLRIKELPVVWDNPAGSTVTAASYLQTLRELGVIFLNRVFGRYALATGPAKHFMPIMAGAVQTGFHYKGAPFVHHADIHIKESAFFNLLRNQKISLGVFFGFVAFAFYLDWEASAIAFFGIITVLYFFDLLFSAFIIFKSYKALPELHISPEAIAALRDEECPTYTIFCPLYKEWRVVPQFVEAMQKLDYPHEKLQVLFLLEENDVETIEKIHTAALPPHFQIVVVPHSKPKTKPKAMNYGLNYASGEYIVIYDAEDVPEPDQLKKAVLAFKQVDNKVACIQAKLNFYNPHQNILTRLFTAEYSLWFDLVLPGFQSIGAPIPLGGTSNHFRADMLRKIGGWDAFNVTEDCDLGMRLAKRGFKTAIVDSTTHEEANSDVMNWYNQRSRWIKGYIQTYFVHMRNPKRYFANGKGKDFFLFQLIVGGKILSLFINPIMWVTTICYFMFRADIGLFIEAFFPGPILYIGVFSLIFGNFLYIYYYMVGCVKRGYDGLIKYVFLIPLYWLGMSIAAWKALYEIVVKPHYWSKTVHGLHLAPATAIVLNTPKTAFDMQAVLMNQPPRIVFASTQKVMPEAPARILTSEATIKIQPDESPAAAGGALPIEEPELVRILSDDTGSKKETWIVKTREFITSSAGLLVMSSVIANVINFTFNAYLGHMLTLAEFGTITIINIFVYLLSLFTNALSSTTIHEVSFFEGTRFGAGRTFFRGTWLYVFLAGCAVVALWVLAVPTVGGYFNVTNSLLMFAFAPAILFGALDSLNKGYLQGTFSFGSTAVAALFEVIIKLGLAIALVTYGFSTLASLAIPGSMIAAWFASTVLVWVVYRKAARVSPIPVAKKRFPFSFYLAALVSGVSVAAFLTSDIILAKHYLSADDAGRYALLSLVGKMIFFFGSLLNTFIMPVVARAQGEKRDGGREFAKIFAGTAFLTVSAATGLAVGGFYFVPLLLGANAFAIVPHIPLYALAMALFTLSTTIVSYGLARKRYLFPLISFAISVAFWFDISERHASIQDFVTTLAVINIFAFAIICFTHFFYNSLVYLGRNVLDVLRVIEKLPKATQANAGKMNILVFNWRDTKSAYAGGAEIYVQGLASRWVAEGHAVTLFTSNDGHLPKNGETDGVRIIRRGGFYATYIIASLYYLVHFRGKFDVIVDSENGIPFFTPLYTEVPVYCLVHHIHQDVFRKSLIWPLSTFACFLEKSLMPLVYRNCNFITVSDSSRREMEKLNITTKEIQVVHPGIDTSFLTPGEKALTPTVSYVGRLKEHKSVDVLIKAFKEVLKYVPGAKLVIAGDGEEEGALRELVKKLRLEHAVTFRGRVSEEAKRDILRESWVFVTPSMIEGWGITVIEASACGTPVIASDVSGLRDSVQNGITGILVPHGNVEQLAAQITHVLQDATLRHTLSANAITWAQHFEWSQQSSKFIGIVSSQLSITTSAEIRRAQHI